MFGKNTLIFTSLLILSLACFLFAQQPAEPQKTEEAKPAAAAPAGNFDVAMKHYKQAHFARAIEEFDKVVAAEPGNAAAYYFLGYAHYTLHHYQEALANFKKAFDTDPKFDPRPYWHR